MRCNSRRIKSLTARRLFVALQSAGAVVFFFLCVCFAPAAAFCYAWRMAYDEIPAQLDELMGKERNLLPHERAGSILDYSDRQVCRYFLCGMESRSPLFFLELTLAWPYCDSACIADVLRILSLGIIYKHKKRSRYPFFLSPPPTPSSIRHFTASKAHEISCIMNISKTSTLHDFPTLFFSPNEWLSPSRFNEASPREKEPYEREFLQYLEKNYRRP